MIVQTNKTILGDVYEVQVAMKLVGVDWNHVRVEQLFLAKSQVDSIPEADIGLVYTEITRHHRAVYRCYGTIAHAISEQFARNGGKPCIEILDFYGGRIERRNLKKWWIE